MCPLHHEPPPRNRRCVDPRLAIFHDLQVGRPSLRGPRGIVLGFGTAHVVRASTASSAATVIMFHRGEPGAKDACDAEAVFKQYR